MSLEHLLILTAAKVDRVMRYWHTCLLTSAQRSTGISERAVIASFYGGASANFLLDLAQEQRTPFQTGLFLAAAGLFGSYALFCALNPKAQVPTLVQDLQQRGPSQALLALVSYGYSLSSLLQKAVDGLTGSSLSPTSS